MREWKNDIESKGWCLFPEVYSKDTISRLKADIDSMRTYYRGVQEAAGVYEESRNAYHHTIVSCSNSQTKLFDPFPLYEEMEDYFEGKFIISACGSTIVNPDAKVYTQNIHRDSRSFIKEKFMVNFVLLLTDSDEVNGSTWVLEGSHLRPDKPSEDEYYSNGVRLNGKAGDMIAFDANLWHSTGINSSDQPRYIITFLLTKPFIKQSLDYTMALARYDSPEYSLELRQMLGFNARIPKTIEEFYKPRELRFYKTDQG
jgi:hypothetical protein